MVLHRQPLCVLCVCLSEINVLKQFVHEGNLYRIFTSLQSKSSADTFCQSYLGQGSQVLKLESQAEFQHISGILSTMQLNGSFWINNSPYELSQASHWAPCQPGNSYNKNVHVQL